MYAGAYEFIEAQIMQHGEDYVWNLSQRGYAPRLTDRGWRWILTSRTNDSNVAYAIDSRGRVC